MHNGVVLKGLHKMQHCLTQFEHSTNLNLEPQVNDGSLILPCI